MFRSFTIYFDKGMYICPKLGEGNKIKQAAILLNGDSALLALLNGHAVGSGSQKMSDNRVTSVKNLLALEGVQRSKMMSGISAPDSTDTDDSVELFLDAKPSVPPDSGNDLNPHGDPLTLDGILGDAMRKWRESLWKQKPDPKPPAPPPGPPPQPPPLPPWMWNELPKRDQPDAWRAFAKKVKDWCQDHGVDPKPMMDALKGVVFPGAPKGGKEPWDLDDDAAKGDPSRKPIPQGPPSDDDD